MRRNFNVRTGGRGDFPALGRIFFRAIRIGARGHYTFAQRRVWAHKAWRGLEAAEKIGTDILFVASDSRNTPVGFMTLRATDGYINFAFVDPGWIGNGVAGSLYGEVERTALELELPRLFVHASLMARPVFERNGFAVLQRETVTVSGVNLDRFEMEKPLHTPPVSRADG